jgi:hypothetical protein
MGDIDDQPPGLVAIAVQRGARLGAWTLIFLSP